MGLLGNEMGPPGLFNHYFSSFYMVFGGLKIRGPNSNGGRPVCPLLCAALPTLHRFPSLRHKRTAALLGADKYGPAPQPAPPRPASR